MVRSDRESYGVSIGIVSRGWTYDSGIHACETVPGRVITIIVESALIG